MAQSAVRVISSRDPAVGGLVTGIPNTQFSAFDVFAGSANGKMLALASLGGLGANPPGDVGLWVYDGVDWSLRVRTSVTTLADHHTTVITQIRGIPMLNDAGEVLLVATLAGELAGTALVRIETDGSARLLLRFGVRSGIGTVPHMPLAIYHIPTLDAVRFTTAGALYSSTVGMITPSGVADEFAVRTFNRVGTFSLPPLSVPVVIGSPIVGMTNSGFSAHRVGWNTSSTNDLTGFLLFDQWGSATLSVQDGVTPIQDQPGMVVTFSSMIPPIASQPRQIATSDPNARMGMNGSGTIAFTGRFGPAPGDTPSPLGTAALFVKPLHGSARLVASVGEPAPGIPNAIFASFGCPAMNRHGRLAFTASVSGPSGTRASIWTTDALDRPQLVALQGAGSGPGSPLAFAPGSRASYARFVSAPSINAADQVVFDAVLSGPTSVGGAPVELDAVCGFTPGFGSTTLLRTGLIPEVTGLGPRRLYFNAYSSAFTVIGAALPSGNDDGLSTRLTDDGRLLAYVSVDGVGYSLLTVDLDLPTGGCCDGATCRITTHSDCSRSTQNQFLGHQIACVQQGQPGACCIADFDHDGRIAVEDLIEFLDAWFAREVRADADLSGIVDLPDLLEFLTTFISGC